MSQRHQFSEALLPLFESDEVVISQAIPEGKLRPISQIIASGFVPAFCLAGRMRCLIMSFSSFFPSAPSRAVT